jgi:serine/threonine-protein phosphatase 2A activator
MQSTFTLHHQIDATDGKSLSEQTNKMSATSSSGDEHTFVRPAVPTANRLEQGSEGFKKGSTSGMQKRICSIEELEKWKKTLAHKQLLQFVQQLNHFAKDKSKGVNDYEEITLAPLISLRTLITELNQLVDQVAPLQNDRGQRFGNKAFRTWIERLEQLVDKFGQDADPPLEEEARLELCTYLRDSFGNYQRIDYGTGHELNFLIVLLGVYKIRTFISTISCFSFGCRFIQIKQFPQTKEIVHQKPAEQRVMRSASEQMLRLLHSDYLPLCRRFQLAYRLEPAGSHGVFSLDDFQYIPFLFGSAELIGNHSIEPRQFPNEEIAARHANEFMFMGAIDFIFKAKSGPFYEHSNQLWNISGVDDWSRINRGLMAKYTDEVLHKFPVVQHVWFGVHVLPWSE